MRRQRNGEPIDLMWADLSRIGLSTANTKETTILLDDGSASQMQPRYNSPVLQQLRNELAALKAWVAQKAWDADGFACEQRTELDAIAHRIIRMAEILRKMRNIVERN